MLRQKSTHCTWLLDWTHNMTNMQPSKCSIAANLVEQISQRSIASEDRYGCSCCFETYDSDDTFWAGSDGEEKVFETANTASNMTKMSSITGNGPVISDPLVKEELGTSSDRPSSQLPKVELNDNTANIQSSNTRSSRDASSSLQFYQRQLTEPLVRNPLEDQCSGGPGDG